MEEFDLSEFELLSKIAERRKSVRKFLDKEIPAEILDKIVEIARTAPFASGRRKWDVEYSTDKTLLSEIAGRVRAYYEKFSAFVKPDFRDDFVKYSESFTLFESAPAVFFLTYRNAQSLSRSLDRELAPPELSADIERFELENSAKSISCAAMLVLLSAESLGLGACYMTGALPAESKFLELITRKQDRRIGAIIPVGYY